MLHALVPYGDGYSTCMRASDYTSMDYQVYDEVYILLYFDEPHG